MADQTKTAATISGPPGGARLSFGSMSASQLLSGWSLVLCALGVCWLLFFNGLRGEWQINAQYNYGYVVPVLGLALLWRRWPTRPSPAPPLSGVWPGFLAAGLLLLLLPLQVCLEANPEWRLLYWIHGFQVVGLSFCLLYRMGGWPWVRYFAAPILFMLIAVPWPMTWEQTAIQGLMRFVAGLTVELAGWLGIAAVQHANVVEVGAGMVGIDEACSGVRSMQSALMLSLFLGELHRFSVPRRLILLAASFGFVLVANLTRTTFLVWAAANRGIHQMEEWHNTAGVLVMIIVLPGLMLMAHWMRPRPKSPAPDAPALPSTSDTAPSSGAAALPYLAFPRWQGISVFAWLALCWGMTEAWYRSHESQLVSNIRWSVAWPQSNAQYRKTTIPETSLAILRCSNSEAGTWVDDDGNEWSAFLLRWSPGKNSAQLSKGHRPEICLTATGARVLEDFGQVSIPTGGFDLPMRYQTFESGSKTLHVFYCLWSDRIAPHAQPAIEDGSQASRIEAVKAGKRHLGQQVLEIVLQGPDSKDEALTVLKQRLPDLLRRE